MKRRIAALLLVLPIVGHTADDVQAARLTLKKWGMAYCLGTFQKSDSENEAGYARGAYFQLGEHADDAYRNVKAYFNRVVPEDTLVNSISGKANNLRRCLDAYEAPDYQQLILQQDKFIGAAME